jgi:hypothetical protein
MLCCSHERTLLDAAREAVARVLVSITEKRARCFGQQMRAQAFSEDGLAYHHQLHKCRTTQVRLDFVALLISG